MNKLYGKTVGLYLIAITYKLSGLLLATQKMKDMGLCGDIVVWGTTIFYLPHNEEEETTLVLHGYYKTTQRFDDHVRLPPMMSLDDALIMTEDEFYSI